MASNAVHALQTTYEIDCKIHFGFHEPPSITFNFTDAEKSLKDSRQYIICFITTITFFFMCSYSKENAHIMGAAVNSTSLRLIISLNVL